MKILSIKHILIMLAVALPVFISCNNDEEEIKLDFDITVPEDWTYYVYANEGFIYAAGRDPVDQNDTILEALYIIKESLPSSTLQLYYNALKNNITKSNAYDSSLYETDTLINGTSFKKLISMETQKMITQNKDTFLLDVITDRYFFYEKEYGYNMVFISLDSLYPLGNKDLFNQIIGTFNYKE